MNLYKHGLLTSPCSSRYQSRVVIPYEECLVHCYVVRGGNTWIEGLLGGSLFFVPSLSDTSFAEPGKCMARIAKPPSAYESTARPAEFSDCRANLPLLTSVPTG